MAEITTQLHDIQPLFDYGVHPHWSKPTVKPATPAEAPVRQEQASGLERMSVEAWDWTRATLNREAPLIAGTIRSTALQTGQYILDHKDPALEATGKFISDHKQLIIGTAVGLILGRLCRGACSTMRSVDRNGERLIAKARSGEGKFGDSEPHTRMEPPRLAPPPRHSTRNTTSLTERLGGAADVEPSFESSDLARIEQATAAIKSEFPAFNYASVARATEQLQNLDTIDGRLAQIDQITRALKDLAGTETRTVAVAPVQPARLPRIAPFPSP